jgi:hypothetical protein
MTPHVMARDTDLADGVLHWTFTRGNEALLCSVVLRKDHAFEVQVTPFAEHAASVNERFHRSSDALRRHAEIAWFLRETGWTLADRRSPHSVAA